MFPRILVLAVVANFAAVPAWSQERPKMLPPTSPPEVLRLSCVLTCDKPCAKWASWQTDSPFSYESCVAKCRKDYRCGS